MGWGLKIGLFFFAVIAATFGAWIITAPVLAYLFLPAIFGRRRSVGSQNRNAKALPDMKGGPPARKVVGGALLLFSFAAFVSGGVWSPAVLAAGGFLILLKPDLGAWLSSRVKPVGDSVLLRASVVPYRWFAMAEAKVSTRDPQGVLSGTKERLLLVFTPALRILLVFAETSISRGRAEERILARMQASARVLAPLGVYLLPVDSKDAMELSRLSSRMRPPEGDLREFLSSADYGAIVMEAESGVVAKLEFFEGGGGRKGAGSAFSSPSTKPDATTLSREILNAVARRVGVPQPDIYATFLSSLAATSGETLGQRITQMSEGSQAQILVSSVGSPQIELSRAQLGAVSIIYA